MDARLDSVLDRSSLRRLAGERVFERGEDYFHGGRVGAFTAGRAEATGKVIGSEPYDVRLWAERNELAASCSCPSAEDGAFCKHAVALGLAVLAGPPPKPRAHAPRGTIAEVRSHLSKQPKASLVDLLVEHALEDERLQRSLRVRTTRERSARRARESLVEAIDRAVGPGELIAGRREVRDYAAGLAEVIDTIEARLEEGSAVEVMGLTEHALSRLEEALGHIDDSDGELRPLLQRLQALHVRACDVARPDPVVLARRLFGWELRSGHELFRGAAVTHARALGPKGLAAYRRLAEAEWRKVRPLGPGAREELEPSVLRRRITSIMETLARQARDVDGLVEVLKKDLSHAYGFLRIAEVYRAAKKPDLALEWAERGARAFPERTDGRLRTFLAEEYHRRGRHDEAMAQIWAEFEERPGLPEYQQLKAHAERCGEWPAWRERAVALVRELIDNRKRGKVPNWAPKDHSLMVEILLLEGDVEAAWSEARLGGCSDGLWLVLAGERERRHPEEAIPVYQRLLDEVLRQAHPVAYADAVKLLRKIRALMVRVERGGEFKAYLESVRNTHRRKVNFMRLLERARWD